MQCLIDLVGIDKVCDPKSGTLINLLQGISIKNVSAGVTEEYTDAKDLLLSMIELATLQVEHDFRVALQPKWRFNSLLENESVGLYKSDLEKTAVNALKYRGIRVRLDSYRYSSFLLSTVTLKVNTSGDQTIKVYDLFTGKLLDSFDITTVAEVPVSIITNKTYNSNGQSIDLLIIADGDFTFTYDAALGNKGCNSCWEYGNRFARFNGAELTMADTPISGNIKSISHTGGLSIGYSVACDQKPFICNMAPLLTMPTLYKAAEMVLLEMQAPNDRINSIVTVHYDDIGRLREYYNKLYDESFSGVVDNMNICDDVCLTCYQGIRVQTQIP
jgi:hypothetical protein